jgi:tripartite-type tricarboxylate transporter receptor subunit TctC
MVSLIALLRPVFFSLAMCAAGASALAQTFPSQPIRLIVPLGAGSSTDIVARLVGHVISEETGQPVVVENLAGADGTVGTRSVLNSRPDGYTVLVNSTGHVTNSHLYKNLGYDPIKDFEPVASLVEFPMYLFVNANSPYKSVDQLMRKARQDPGRITFASATAAQRLMGEMLQQKAGVQIVNVPYRTTAAALTDLAAGGLVDLQFTDLASAKGQWDAGRIKPLAVGGSKRSAQSPNTPTVDEAGVKGYDLVGSWFGAWVPAHTPPDVVKRLNVLFTHAVQDPKVKAALAPSGIEPLVMSREEFVRFQKSETDKMGRVVKEAGIPAQ